MGRSGSGRDMGDNRSLGPEGWSDNENEKRARGRTPQQHRQVSSRRPASRVRMSREAIERDNATRQRESSDISLTLPRRRSSISTPTGQVALNNRQTHHPSMPRRHPPPSHGYPPPPSRPMTTHPMGPDPNNPFTQHTPYQTHPQYQYPLPHAPLYAPPQCPPSLPPPGPFYAAESRPRRRGKQHRPPPSRSAGYHSTSWATPSQYAPLMPAVPQPRGPPPAFDANPYRPQTPASRTATFRVPLGGNMGDSATGDSTDSEEGEEDSSEYSQSEEDEGVAELRRRQEDLVRKFKKLRLRERQRKELEEGERALKEDAEYELARFKEQAQEQEQRARNEQYEENKKLRGLLEHVYQKLDEPREGPSREVERAVTRGDVLEMLTMMNSMNGAGSSWNGGYGSGWNGGGGQWGGGGGMRDYRVDEFMPQLFKMMTQVENSRRDDYRPPPPRDYGGYDRRLEWQPPRPPRSVANDGAGGVVSVDHVRHLVEQEWKKLIAEYLQEDQPPAPRRSINDAPLSSMAAQPAASLYSHYAGPAGRGIPPFGHHQPQEGGGTDSTLPQSPITQSSNKSKSTNPTSTSSRGSTTRTASSRTAMPKTNRSQKRTNRPKRTDGKSVGRRHLVGDYEYDDAEDLMEGGRVGERGRTPYTYRPTSTRRKSMHAPDRVTLRRGFRGEDIEDMDYYPNDDMSDDD
ncbi:hypothetical protein MKZ38_003553 [Zalerion maritima]|uniref:Uncharacterized protein n=1 Tax=Zalerion maritima TaxID=339359 RepID=A0AAD5WSC9_9PEZI|nr:hypothetical protein MKZ38_003553 [Zalerion maritima]